MVIQYQKCYQNSSCLRTLHGGRRPDRHNFLWLQRVNGVRAHIRYANGDPTPFPLGILMRRRMRLPNQPLRKSLVNGNSLLPGTLMVAGGTFITPGVWPVSVKRVKRRLSASNELTGKLS